MSYKAQRVRCPVHNIIPFEATQFDDVIWKAIQTRPFQRLRRIKQLGFSDLVYPGATHSRFAHSVGVFHTARRLMHIVEAKVGKAGWNTTKANAALAAALVHDVGHGPFSHAFEEVGRRLSLPLAHHEAVSDLIIRDSELTTPLKELGSGFASDVADVIASKGPRSVYDAVVSSQFDADRLDYIQRDRLSAGTYHGVIDFEWLVDNIEVATLPVGVDEQQVSNIDTFVIGPKGVLAAEAYVLGLFHLYPTVYLHKATRGAEKLFTELIVRVFKLSRDGSVHRLCLSRGHPLVQFALEPDNLTKALSLDDTVISGALSILCGAKDKLVSSIAMRLRDRVLFKSYDVREGVARRIRGAVPTNELESRVSKVSALAIIKLEEWKQTKPTQLVLRDEASRSPYKHFEESKGPLNQIMVRTPDGALIDLGKYSSVVAGIPTFEVVRYYADRNNTEFATAFEAILDGEVKHGL